MIVDCIRCGFRRGEHSNKLMRTPGGFLCVSAQMCDRRRKLRDAAIENTTERTAQ